MSLRIRAAIMRFLARYRFPVQVGIDSAAWALALSFVTLARYDFQPELVDGGGLVVILPLAAVAQTLSGLACGLYTGHWRFGSFEEVAGLARAAGLTAVILFPLDLWIEPRMVPLSAVPAGALIALVLMASARYLWRHAIETQRRPRGEDLQRLLVFGAGEGGAQVVTSMLRDPASLYLPVALLDDDPHKRNLRILGVPVVGTRERIGDAAAQHDAHILLIAIPSAGAQLVSELSDLAAAHGLEVRVVPSVTELFGGRVGLGDIREVTDADLLGRHEIQTDVDAIAHYLAGKRVLVTGAGGSIGSELCRQIARFEPGELIMLDRDESALHAVQLSIEGRALLDSPDLVLLDIRDPKRLKQVFMETRPEVVFHAAALKHLPLLERHPAEALKTNIWGTLAMLEAAAAAGVERFVNVSTDKAADPISVLGYSKRIAERMTAWFAAATGRAYLSVRFGNVLGSRGSVLGAFHAQIAAGGPITVTDPEVSRFFMTTEEAVQLVIQAGVVGGSGSVLVLDMGEPVKISDVARLLASRAERPIDIVYTGLRPGEKLQEALLGASETGATRVHPLIFEAPVPALDPEAVRDIDPSVEVPVLIEELRATSERHAVHLT